MMNRKDFLKYLASGVALGGMRALTPGMALSRSLMGPFQKDQVKLAILYTNDTHSRIEPDSRIRGGIARRATLIQQIKSKYSHTLLLDAGDTFQGTPWFHRYGGGFQFRVMSKLGYQAMVLGNHEFDNGINALAAAIRKDADFPVLAANYDVDQSPLKGLVEPFTVLPVGDARIGVFGLGIPLDGLVTKSKYRGVRIRNPLSVARGMVRSLRTYKKCDMVIALSHLGYRYDDPSIISDHKIAQQVSGIDLIIGGHTHTALAEVARIKHASGWETVITQTGSDGTRVGKLDVLLRKSDDATEVQV
jgi:5'-nucleotidase